MVSRGAETCVNQTTLKRRDGRLLRKDSHMTARNNLLDQMRRARYDVEHTLSMYAYSFVHLPATGIYDPKLLEPFADTIKACHIYFIGFLPRLSIVNVEQLGQTVAIHIDMGLERKSATWQFPDGYRLKHKDEVWFVEDQDGKKYRATDEMIWTRLAEQDGPSPFDVRYIGQAYGRDGSRSSLDRLLGHEKLQEIALRGAPKGHAIALIMVEVQPNNQIITTINPHAHQRGSGRSRITPGVDKLFNTTESERIALYEAAMIRYFQPQYNTEFKNSFPSTNLKILQDCYAKDFSSVIAEFGFDSLPFALQSDIISPTQHHFAHYDLHTEDERRSFFQMVVGT
jgi:hypothetical protein